MGGRLIITNDRLIFWGSKLYSSFGQTDFGIINTSFLNDLRGIKPFADRSVGLRNGTYSGRLFSVEDAEVDKPLREAAPELGTGAKCAEVIYHSNVSVVYLFDVYTPKGFWKSRTDVLIGLDLSKGEGRFFKTWANYRIPFLSTQELADMLKRTPLSIKDFMSTKTQDGVSLV